MGKRVGTWWFFCGEDLAECVVNVVGKTLVLRGWKMGQVF
jgi:hypothetical protein